MKDLRNTIKEGFDVIKVSIIIGFIAVMWVWTSKHRKHEYAVIH